MRLYRSRLASCVLFVTALAVVVGCSEKKSDPKGGDESSEPAEPAKPVEPTEKPGVDKTKPGATPEADGAQKAHPECVGPITKDGAAKTFKIGELEFELQGAVLTLKTGDDDDEYSIGQLTDVKDFTPENEKNLKIAAAWFKAEKVDAIAVTGDLGESVESIAKVLEVVATVGVPVLAIAGNRECRAHFNGALDQAAAKNPHVINMNKVRVFNTDDASFVSLPGYYNKSYIHCAEGCEYFPSDVKALDEAAALASAPAKVLLSHGPPKMDGETGLDRIHEEVNVGDPELAKYLAGGKFPFGLFGNIQEAGGYGTDLSGKNRIKQGVWASQLYLNPGPIDAVRWAMLDGTESLGMAGILQIKGKQAKYKIRRIKPGEAAPK